MGTEDWPHPKIILLVENDQDIAFVLCSALKEEKCWHTLLAMSGREALKIVSEISPHLCVLDYRLPDMDGLKLAGAIRAKPGCAQVPVLLMTTHPPTALSTPEPYLLREKPFDLEDFLRHLKELS